MKHKFRQVLLLLLPWSLFAFAEQPSALQHDNISQLPVSRPPVYVAIIIDDMGHNPSRDQRALQLPGALTYAVLPYTPYASIVARSAHTMNKEVMVHLPMANTRNHPLGPGTLALTRNLNKTDFLRTLNAAIQRVPHARGLNNHTGSYLTQQKEQMTWLMEDIKQREFFFIDSRTTPKTVAQNIAHQKDILNSSRDVFLDNDRSYYAIDRAFKELLRKARQRGTAIGIGHPHPTTLDYLHLTLPGLAKENVQVLPASRLLAMQQSTRVARKVTAIAAAQLTR